MKYLLIIALCLATTVHAKIGETRSQIIQRFGQSAIVEQDEDSITFKSKNRATIMFLDGRSAVEAYEIPGKFNNEDADEIVATVTGVKADMDHWYVASDLLESNNHKFKVMSAKGSENWVIAVGLKAPLEVFADAFRKELKAVPSDDTPDPNSFDPKRTPQDCAVIAAQNYARLKPVTAWAQIVSIRGTKQWGKRGFGHAAVVFKYQHTGNVFFIDSTGTRDLASTDQTEEGVQSALNAIMAMAGTGFEVTQTKFLTKTEY